LTRNPEVKGLNPASVITGRKIILEKSFKKVETNFFSEVGEILEIL
jgi:hypothetical protein